MPSSLAVLRDAPDIMSQRLDSTQATAELTATSRLRRQREPGRKHKAQVEDSEALGGLRNVAQSVRKVAGHVEIGPQIATVVDSALAEVPHLQE